MSRTLAVIAKQVQHPWHPRKHAKDSQIEDSEPCAQEKLLSLMTGKKGEGLQQEE